MRYFRTPMVTFLWGQFHTLLWYDQVPYAMQIEMCAPCCRLVSHPLPTLPWHCLAPHLHRVPCHLQNPNMFVWGVQEVKVGLLLGIKDGVWTNDETLNSIHVFPHPTKMTGICSGFSLVEQVAFAFSKSDLILPFPELLMLITHLCWTPFETAQT